MHLAERGGRRGLMAEARELRLPVGTEFRRHAPPHEGPAHGRGLALQLTELGDIFRRQRLGDGGEQLRHLHDRPLQAAERGGQRRGILVAGGIEPKQPPPGDARGDAADIGADGRIAGGAGGEPVLFAVGRAVGHVT